MKIAFTRLSSLGDIILCLPLLQLIRRFQPDCHITWITDRRFAGILDYQPDIQQIIPVDLKGVKKELSLKGLRNEYRNISNLGPFDAVIDLHGMIKSAVIGSILGGSRYGFDRHVLKEPLCSLFYQKTFLIPLEMPAACRYASLAMHSLELPFCMEDMYGLKPFLFSHENDLKISSEFLSKTKHNIILVPETSARNKNYPVEKFARLTEMLRENVLLCHGNQQELETANRIAAMAGNASVLPRLDLNQLKAAISHADLVIGGDSGPTHIAWATGVPSITLFGATPVCFIPTGLNLVIKTPNAVNLRKPDKNDFSVTTISEQSIYELSLKLLSSKNGVKP